MKIPCLMCFWRGESHIDSQVEFCQQSDGLWARGDEQKLSRQYTKAICHDSCCNPYDAHVLIKSNDFGVSEIVQETSSIPAYR